MVRSHLLEVSFGFVFLLADITRILLHAGVNQSMLIQIVGATKFFRTKLANFFLLFNQTTG